MDSISITILPNMLPTSLLELLNSWDVACTCSVTKSYATLCDLMDYSTPCFPIPHNLPEFAQVHVHWIIDAIQPSYLLSPSSSSAFNPSHHQGLSKKLAFCIRCPKYWSFSISPSNECSGLISFETDWIVLLAVQRTLKSLLQHHSLKAPILWCSAFFMVNVASANQIWAIGWMIHWVWNT